MKPLYLILAVLYATSIQAMPTKEEIAKAEPLVQEVMKSEMEALRLNKKTRAQVGAAAFKLAQEAQAPAEKYLLLTGAFDLYVRGGAFDEAAAALGELKKAIPDFPEKDEYALLEKAVRSVSSAKSDVLRERHTALGKRINNRARLEKLLTQAKKTPSDKSLHFRIATYQVYFDDWSSALDEFLLSDNAACIAAAQAEKDPSTPKSKIADAWWSASDIKPDFLSSVIRSHAVTLYRQALADKSLAGLQKVAAEKRIKEHESELAVAETKSSAKLIATSSIPSVGVAKYYGVELVGNSVKEKDGVLSGFSLGSFAKLKAPFSPGEKSFEVVVEFTTGTSVGGSGILGCLGKKGFIPFSIVNSQVVSYLSSNGMTDDIVSGEPVGLRLTQMTTYRVKCTWDGKQYAWYIWSLAKWRRVRYVSSKTPVFGGQEIQMGSNRTRTCAFNGTVDLSKAYICIDGKLWWEGIKGAYKNANQ